MAARTRIWEDARIRGTAKLVALAIGQMADPKDGWARIRHAELAELSTCGLQSLKRALSTLEALAILETIRGGAGRGDLNAYRLKLEGIHWESARPIDRRTQPREDEAGVISGDSEASAIGFHDG